MNSPNPIVPIYFDPRVTSDDASYLKAVDSSGGQIVSWPVVGESLFVPAYQYWPDLEAIEKANAKKFTSYGAVGFSLGKYHEFVVEPMMWDGGFSHPSELGAKLGGIEVTFGYATPLMAFLLEGLRDKHVGTWDEFTTVRILGADHGTGEVAFLNACRWHHQVTGIWPRLMPVDLDYAELPPAPGAAPIASAPAMCANLEPLRFLYAAMTQKDDTAACVYLYKIVEYFAFFGSASQMSALRHDHTVSNFEFSKKVLDLVFKDEKGPIFKVVQDIADSAILYAAADQGLPHDSHSKLADALYSFRNSIVHGKYSSGFTIEAASVLDLDSLARKWRPVLLLLAQGAIQHYATPMD